MSASVQGPISDLSKQETTPTPETATPAATGLVEPVATDTVAAPTETGVLTETPSATIPAASATPFPLPTASATVAPTDLLPTLEPTAEPTVVLPAPLQPDQPTTVFLPLVSGGSQPVAQSSTSCTDTGGAVYLVTRGELGRSRDFYTASTPCWEDVRGNFAVPIGSGGIVEFVLDPFDPTNHAWAAIGNHPIGGHNAAAVWRTTNLDDASPTWSKVLDETDISACSNQAGISRLQASTVLPGLIFVVAGCNDSTIRVGRSLDYGTTWWWSGSLGPSNGVNDRNIGFALSGQDPNRLWLGGSGGRVLVSQNMGVSFTELEDLENNYWYPYDIHVPAYDNPDEQVMFVVNGDDYRKVWRSTDGGGSFTDVTGANAPRGNFGAVDSFDRNSQLVTYVSLDCGLKFSGWKVYGSGDAGQTWSQVSTDGSTFSVVWRWPTNPNRMLVANMANPFSNGVVARVSTDGGITWSDKNSANWWTLYGTYSSGAGSCGGTAPVTIIDAEAVPVVPLPSTRNQISGAKKTGPNPALGADGREGGLTTYDGTDCVCGDPINTLNGSFDYSTADLSLPTVAGALAFQRSYASTATGVYTTTLGPGWTSTWTRAW